MKTFRNVAIDPQQFASSFANEADLKNSLENLRTISWFETQLDPLNVFEPALSEVIVPLRIPFRRVAVGKAFRAKFWPLGFFKGKDEDPQL